MESVDEGGAFTLHARAPQDQGKFVYEMSPAVLPKLVENAVRAHEDAAAAAGVRLAVECDAALRSVRLLMDGGRISQVVTNFLSNAIKFTPRGGLVTSRVVVVAAPGDQALQTQRAGSGASDSDGGGRRDDRSSNAWTVRVSVTDTGRGLGTSDLGRLFQPYTQIRAAEMQAGCVCLCVSRILPLSATAHFWLAAAMWRAGAALAWVSPSANTSLRRGTAARSAPLHNWALGPSSFSLFR